jgi:hypothetical protein
MSASKNRVGILALIPLMIGCATDSVDPAATPEPEPATGDGMSPTEMSEVRTKIDIYTQALVDRDVNALAGIVSSEIISRSIERHVDLQTFLDRQRDSMFRTFRLTQSDRPAFEVTDAVLEGGNVRVTLRFRGEDLRKSLYLVPENGELKLNIARPGFSKSNRSRSNYQVHNTNFSGDAVVMGCWDADVTTTPGQTKSVNCLDTCGSIWSGSIFQRFGGTYQRYCDWNSWGDDVIVNWGYYDGWDCNDYC